MPTALLTLLLACSGAETTDSGTTDSVATGVTGHDNGFGPGACAGHAVSLYWNPEAGDWVAANGSPYDSQRHDFACSGGHITRTTTTSYDGADQQRVAGRSTQTDWTWDGDTLVDQTTTVWDGETHALTPESTQVRTTADDQGRIHTQDTWFWDETDGWFLGAQTLGTWSTRVETVYGGDGIRYRESTWWQGNSWATEPATSVVASQKWDHVYEDAVLAHTTALFTDGSTWYVGWENPCCISWRTMLEWDDQGRLSATETRHWDSLSQDWIVGWQFSDLLSVRTEYTWD